MDRAESRLPSCGGFVDLLPYGWHTWADLGSRAPPFCCHRRSSLSHGPMQYGLTLKGFEPDIAFAIAWRVPDMKRVCFQTKRAPHSCEFSKNARRGRPCRVGLTIAPSATMAVTRRSVVANCLQPMRS